MCLGHDGGFRNFGGGIILLLFVWSNGCNICLTILTVSCSYIYTHLSSLEIVLCICLKCLLSFQRRCLITIAKIYREILCAWHTNLWLMIKKRTIGNTFVGFYKLVFLFEILPDKIPYHVLAQTDLTILRVLFNVLTHGTDVWRVSET